jgi:Rrf2 family protein
MKLGKRARYTLRLMVGIGRASGEGRRIALSAIAKSSGISKRYLDQLSISLKNASLIKGRSGRNGGYTLSRPAAEIKIGQILEAATGPIDIAECVTAPDICSYSDDCNCRLFWTLIHQRLFDVFNGYSLADLLNQGGSDRLKHELAILVQGKPTQSLGSDNDEKETQEYCPSSG